MDNNNSEVKDFVEEVKIEPAGDNEETITPEENENSLESSQEKQETEAKEETTEVEETETQSSGQQDEPPKEEVKEEVKEVIKEVEGETPRERALRLEVTRLKREQNKNRRDELFVPKEQPRKENEALSQYDPEQVAEVKKIFGVVADELGFVKKDEINSSKRDEIFEEFMEKHPEYSVDKDPEGVMFAQLKEEFSVYKDPKTAKEFQQLLYKAHNTIFKPASINLNKINAQKEKTKVVSHTGGTAGIKSKPQKVVKPDLRLDALQGFSEEEKNELFAD